MANLKIALLTSIICIILGIGIIIGGAIALPLINSTLDNLQTQVQGYLEQANNALSSAQNAINSTEITLFYLSSATNISLPDLSQVTQLTDNIAANLTAISQTVAGVGQTLSSISVAGVSPFTAVGNSLASIGQPIASAADSVQNVSSRISSIREQAADLPSRLETISIQLDNVKTSLSNLRGSVTDVLNSLPGYFNTIKLVALLAVVGVMGLGAVFLLIGLSLFTLRRKANEHTKSIYRFYSKYPA
ncbi:MAG: hypothetical protein ACQCN6_14620 [Candidatus Bathyarchaeia archaeon]